MGFCRRCGDIVTGLRCKCGGAPVAPVVPWNLSHTPETATDKWSNTYIHRERSVSPTRSINTYITDPTVAPTSPPVKRFPRPVSGDTIPKSELSNRVTAHIASTTSQPNQTPIPFKYTTILAAPESDILPSLSPYDTTLSKVYGSVLQPKESLTTHSCAICSVSFPPDATIYPDPNAIDSSRFLCKKCFTRNGGSRGDCPTCSRPVLMLKSEGGFVHAAHKYWHKRCFNCAGCFKNIGDSPMLDLMGRPSCVQCFDNCLKRDPGTPKKNLANSSSSLKNEKSNNISSMKANSTSYHNGEVEKPGSPIEELEQWSGITKSRDESPSLEELSQRLNMIGRDLTFRQSISGSSSTNSNSVSYTSRSRGGSPSVDHSKEQRDFQQVDTSNFGSQYFRSKKMKSSTSSPRGSPVRNIPSAPSPQATRSPAPTLEAIEEMKQRFMNGCYSPSAPKSQTHIDSPESRMSMYRSRSSTSLKEISISSRVPAPRFYDDPPSPPSSAAPPTPDLTSDHSDTATQSSFSGPESPRDYGRTNDIFNVSNFTEENSPQFTKKDFPDGSSRQINQRALGNIGTPLRTLKSLGSSENISNRHSRPLPTPTPTPLKSQTLKPSLFQPRPPNSVPSPQTSDLATSACCAACGGRLFSIGEGRKFVTVPSIDESTEPMLYHVECFRCGICKDIFKDASTGHAVFVRVNGSPCHVECTPPTEVTIRKVPSLSSFRSKSIGISPPITTPASTSTHISSSRFDRPATGIPPTTSLPRFGSRTTCPGCHKPVSPMEQGVVPGPQGTRWHASCLVCGGKKEATKMWKKRTEKGEPGCGKRLDSAAKSGGDGGVWCRECLLLLGVGGSPQVSPIRTPIIPSHTGPDQVITQLTGTTIARQFTGLGGSGGSKEVALLRHLTGGGLSPTRSISPTKQFGASGRPRPKSVIGMRNSKSIDEGRGMFLVRQLTGASSGGWIG